LIDYLASPENTKLFLRKPQEARDRLEESEDRYNKALSAAYNRIYFPGIDGMDGRDTLVSVTIDNGLNLGHGDQSAEIQIDKLLSSPRANYKLAMDLKEKLSEYFSMAESELWPSGHDSRRIPWKDLISRAKNNSAWPWMPGNNGMDFLKGEALKQGRWRLGEDGYVEKGPFPRDKTTVNITFLGVNPDSGESILSLTPRNAGESPVIFYSTKPEVSEKDLQVEEMENFSTGEGSLYFWVKDTTGTYESGDSVSWIAELKIRYLVEPSADKRKVALQCTPKAVMTYTLDGTNPKDGNTYEGPIEIGPKAVRLLVLAKSGKATKNADFKIPHGSDSSVQIDDTKPGNLRKSVTLDTTDRVYGVINHFRKKTNTLFKGVKIEMGEGENTVTVRFLERKINAIIIEGVVNSLREILQEDQSPVVIKIIDYIEFDSGFDIKEFAKIVSIDLRPGEVTQE
ncbi:MAG: chitobiase/beta-hexosaminidase C-terminal domain-containing protein, partial [Gammaproteobacteria bacterium]|nr:chitobiase/beta-hexosaminidase C-terminal domain-containing protein [Gammaproteobacteria bacterium]